MRAVGVIVVNWNGGTDTTACLASLAAAAHGPARVIVIDNDSSDDSMDLVRTWAHGANVTPTELALDERTGAASSWLTIVRSPRNLGFSGANNVGLALLRDDPRVDDVLLLNNDATVEPSYFVEMERARGALPDDAAILGPTIYHMPATDRVWYAGGRAIALRGLVAHELVRPADVSTRPTEFVTGCAMYVTRAALDRLGFLSDCYAPGYMEDAEYCWRARASGVGVYYAPGAIVYHRVGVSFDRVPGPSVTYTKNRNRVFFVRRNLRGTVRAGALAYLALTKPLRALADLAAGRRAQASAVIRGAWDGFVSVRANDP